MISDDERLILEQKPHAHPAAQAWCEVSGEPAPRRIDALRGSRKRPRAVYRLHGVGPAGTVIAKRSPEARARTEQLAYATLAETRVPVPRLFGAQPASDSWWLFIEDGAGRRMDTNDPDDRRRFASWLANLHGTEVAIELPERTAEGYRGKLERILQQLTPDHGACRNLPAVVDLVRLLAGLERQWPALAAAVHEVPWGIVHGDIAAKNVIMRGTPGNAQPFVIDWEYSGRGPVAIDLSRPDDGPPKFDAETYAEARRVDLGMVERWSETGCVLRYLDGLSWQAWSVEHDCAIKATAHLPSYARGLAEALRRARWAV